jgi:hypothetical protein
VLVQKAITQSATLRRTGPVVTYVTFHDGRRLLARKLPPKLGIRVLNLRTFVAGRAGDELVLGGSNPIERMLSWCAFAQASLSGLPSPRTNVIT